MEVKLNTALHATGASFISSSSDHNPRDLVIELIREKPELPRKDLFEEFRSMLQDAGDDYRRAVEYYFFVNMYDYLVTSRNRKPDPVDRARAVEARRDAIERIKYQIVLLDLTMPNGKTMKECTGAEMAKFGNRYQKIADRVGKGKLVGAVLNEDQVRDIMK